MIRIKLAIGLLALTLILSTTGCKADEPTELADDVLQLSNDILEDPLLKELDALEEALLNQTEPPVITTSSSPTIQEADSEPPAATPKSTATAPVAPAAPAVTPAAPQPAPTPPVETPTARAEISKKIVFGIVKKTSDIGISLRVIQTKILTQEELRRIKNGEDIPRILLTDEVLRLKYASSAVIEKMVNNSPVTALASDVSDGQTVRVSLNQSGEITLLRILRN